MSYRIKGGLIAIIVGLMFLLVGLIFTHFTLSNVRHRCSEEVGALIIGYDEFKSIQPEDAGFKTGAITPIFRYEYDGVEYEGHENFYTTGLKYKLTKRYPDGNCILKVNPENPSEIYFADLHESSKPAFIVLDIVGSLVILLGVVEIFDKDGKIIKTAK